MGAPAVPHAIGTLAHIDSGDMPQLGLLVLDIRGGHRFRIISQSTQPDGLLRAQVMLLDEPDHVVVLIGRAYDQEGCRASLLACLAS